MTINDPLVPLLAQLEQELTRMALWQSTPPSAAALQSEMPFSLDTLEPEQWLQWIFLPRIHMALANGTVPRGFSLTPYFAEVWQDQPHFSALVLIIEQIDEACR